MNIQKIISQKNIVKLAGLTAGSMFVTNNLVKKEISGEETLDYIENSPNVLYAKSQVYYQEESGGLREGETLTEYIERRKRGSEEQLEADEIKEINEFDIQESLPVKIETDEDFNESIKMIKNPKLKAIAQSYYDQKCLYQATAELLQEIDVNSADIDDPKILEYLNYTYDELLNVKLEENESDCCVFPFGLSNKFENAIQVIDAYNTIKGKYSQIKSLATFWGEIKTYYENSMTYDYLKSEHIEAYEEETEEPLTMRDLLNAHFESDGEFTCSNVENFILKQKSEVLEKIRDYDMQKYLYEMYLDEINLPEEAKEICKKIETIYDVKIMPSADSTDYVEELSYIEAELEAWKIASKNSASISSVLTLNGVDSVYRNNIVGVNKLFKDSIGLKDGFLSTIESVLRHEIMHQNDRMKYAGKYVGEENAKLLKEIMPTKVVNGKTVRDFKNCKYREEFLNAGVNPGHVSYAYTNRAEFIAVAAEGDLSRYSPEFKEILIKLGMPEFVFNLKVLNPVVEKNCRYIDKIKNKNPEVKDFETLAKLMEIERILERKRVLEAIMNAMDNFDEDDE